MMIIIITWKWRKLACRVSIYIFIMHVNSRLAGYPANNGELASRLGLLACMPKLRQLEPRLKLKLRLELLKSGLGCVWPLEIPAGFQVGADLSPSTGKSSASECRHLLRLKWTFEAYSRASLDDAAFRGWRMKKPGRPQCEQP